MDKAEIRANNINFAKLKLPNFYDAIVNFKSSNSIEIMLKYTTSPCLYKCSSALKSKTYRKIETKIMKMKSKYFSLLLLLLVTISSCTNAKQPKDNIPSHDEFTIESKQVGETRNINVWTPPEYKTGTDSLPVMYMADGGIIDEDFPHIANTLSELITAKKIPPMILVGIANTQRRRDLSGPTEIEKDKEVAPVVGGSEKFRAFIKEELFPEISKRYRTTSEKSIIGESLSGLFVVETFFLTPEMFDNYIAFDPSLWWNNHYLVRTAKEHLALFPKTEKRYGLQVQVQKTFHNIQTAWQKF
jgi:predicted alpha/beta superfamily hydrolase